MLIPVRLRSPAAVSFLATATVIGVLGSSVAAEQLPVSPAPKNTTAVIHCDYPPVSYWDKNTGAPSGFFVEIMDIIGQRAGLNVTYVCESGWPEMIKAIETGKADLGALMKSSEREKRLLFTAPVEMTYLSFFARSQSAIADSQSPAGTPWG